MKTDETLYISDLDGTLLRDDQTLSEQTSSYLMNAVSSGLNFTFATARSVVSSEFVLQGLGLQLPVILYNGAQIYCPKEKRYIHTEYMAPAVFSDLLQRFFQDGLDPVVHCVDKNEDLRVYFQSVSNESSGKWINSRLKNGDERFRVTVDFSEIEADKVIEIMAVGPQERLKAYEAMLDAEPTISWVLSEDIYCEGYYWLEVYHANANKGNAVRKLQDHLGLANVVSFGDNYNDLPMFRVSTRSFAVGNANEIVKQVASEVIGLNNDGAVVAYMKKYVANL